MVGRLLLATKEPILSLIYDIISCVYEHDFEITLSFSWRKNIIELYAIDTLYVPGCIFELVSHSFAVCATSLGDNCAVNVPTGNSHEKL